MPGQAFEEGAQLYDKHDRSVVTEGWTQMMIFRVQAKVAQHNPR